KKPAEPAKPAEVKKPAEPVKPAEVKKPAEPVKPAEVKKPAEPVKPVEVKKPVEEAKPVEPVETQTVEEKKKKVEQYYFDSPQQLEDRESGIDITEPKKEVQKKLIRYNNENSTSKIPFVYNGLPSTAYGTGLIMGGNSSNENSYYIDGVKVPFSHHMLTEKSVIDRNVLKSTYIYSGNFGPELGDSIGGVTNLSFKDPRTDRIGGTFDLSMFGVSLMSEGPLAKSNYFSISFDFGSDDLFTRLAYDDENSIVSQGNLSGHIRYLSEIDDKNSIVFTIAGARDNLYHLSTMKSKNVPVLSESLSPEIMFILAKGDYIYKTESINSRFTGSFVLSNFDYHVFGGDKLNTIDNRGTIEEHLSFKINEGNRFDLGVVFAAGIFSTDTSFLLLPLEGEPGMIRSAGMLDQADNIGYIHPSLYLKYRFLAKGFEAVPGVYVSGDFHNRDEWSGTIDPRLYLAYDITKWMKVYANGGMYSKRPQYDIAFHKLGNEALKHEKAVHAKLGFAFEYEGFTADASGFYKYFYDLIRRNPEKITDYENTGTGWAAGTEIKAGYSNKEVNGWVSYSFVKSLRTDGESAGERRADGDIPHIFKAALSYNFLKNWTVSGDISVASGTLMTGLAGTTYLADAGIYMPLYQEDDINGIRISNSVGYGFRIEYALFFKDFILGIYGDIKGSNAKMDVVYNRDYSESGGLYLYPVLGTVGVKGDF
ncbi:MAG TPA: TonB-dependent receptor, partial [bacterium]|nr:TonB-dependent receptor [bacterium]